MVYNGDITTKRNSNTNIVIKETNDETHLNKNSSSILPSAITEETSNLQTDTVTPRLLMAAPQEKSKDGISV